MSRDLEAAMVAAATAETVRPEILLALYFDSGTARMTTAPRELVYDADGDGIAETFLGVGNLGRIGTVQESAELRAINLELELSGIPPEVLALALGENYQRRPATAWLVFNDASHRPVGKRQIFKGQMDVMTIECDVEARIQLTVENNLADMERPRLLLFTDQDQQQIWPGDKGLAYIPQTVDREIVWGQVGDMASAKRLAG